MQDSGARKEKRQIEMIVEPVNAHESAFSHLLDFTYAFFPA